MSHGCLTEWPEPGAFARGATSHLGWQLCGASHSGQLPAWTEDGFAPPSIKQTNRLDLVHVMTLLAIRAQHHT